MESRVNMRGLPPRPKPITIHARIVFSIVFFFLAMSCAASYSVVTTVINYYNQISGRPMISPIEIQFFMVVTFLGVLLCGVGAFIYTMRLYDAMREDYANLTTYATIQAYLEKDDAIKQDKNARERVRKQDERIKKYSALYSTSDDGK